MPQTTKQLPPQQHIIQHTSHSSTTTTFSGSSSSNNSNSHLQHVHQVHLANTSSALQQQQYHHTNQRQQQQPSTQHQTHMIQISEEYLEQAQAQTQNHISNTNPSTSNMMISATGEVIQQQQIFKIVSTDAATGNMIIDTSGGNHPQNANASSTTSKVLLSNLTVLSKQTGTASPTLAAGQPQSSVSSAQTINFVNAKQLYTASNQANSGGVMAASLGKQQKFTVSSANLSSGNFKPTALKQTTNTQYIHQTAGGPQKITMTGSRNMQVLTASRIQTTGGNSHAATTPQIASNAGTAQTMVVQQPHKFVTSSSVGPKSSSLGPGVGNIIKKTTLRMSNSNTSGTAPKMMNNLHAQTPQTVKTFITQTTSSGQQQQQQNNNQMTTLQQHHVKGGSTGSKSKIAKQYNNTILNSAGAVAIATLPLQQQQSQLHQNSASTPTPTVAGQYQPQTQHQHGLATGQSAYINHHKTSVGVAGVGAAVGTTKINKISSKYAAGNVAAQLPPGTQLHQKTVSSQGASSATQQQQSGANQQQYPTSASSNSNIKFVNAQGTIVQQHQPLTPQKIHIKQQHHATTYPSMQNQNFESLEGNSHFSQQQQQISNSATAGSNAASSVTGAVMANSPNQLNDDIMMVNGTQMTDELSARILQSMSQKSFINQRYQQLQQQHQHTVFQKSPTTSSSNNSSSTSGNTTMLPPSQAANAPISAVTQQPTTTPHTSNAPNNHSNILLSPREYTLYPSVVGGSTSNQQQIPSPQQQSPTNNQAAGSPGHYGNAPSLAAASPANYLSNSMATIIPHSSSGNTVVAAAIQGSQTLASTSRLAQSAPNSRSQSMERKLHESSISRKSTEYYKVNNHNSLRSSHSNLAPAHSAANAHTGGGGGGAVGVSIAASSSLSSLSSTSSSMVASAASTAAASVHMNSGGAAILPSRSPSITAQPSQSTMLDHHHQAQVQGSGGAIYLQTTKASAAIVGGSGGANNSSKDNDDIIGEEVRPVPVETHDIRLQILHAVLLDHTYANPMPLQLPTTFAVQPSISSASMVSSGVSSYQNHQQQWSLGGIGAATNASGNVANSANASTSSNYPMYSSQLSRLQQDDDAYSAISNNSSRPALGDIDPGEETETAPEAEAEDDSVTRCICDLTHDDGYMICCDKCCAWQHVDCMGIDRQNIPDEYLCELCQPRPVDKARARALQVQKRKEQTQMILVQTQQATAAGLTGAAGSAIGSGGGNCGSVNLSSETLAMQQRVPSSFNLVGGSEANAMLLAANGTNLKKGAKSLKKGKETAAGKKSKKADKLSGAGSGMAGGKVARKETKKNTKRKKAGHDGIGSTVGMTAAEKHAANLRQWIENYELAVTNHYSPELRARLHGITKQPSLLQSILNTENPVLKDFSMGKLENCYATVPHAGGKILISKLDVTPNSPICELRGKYMLTTQYKTQNTSINMNCPPPNNYQMASYKAHKTPGPFIFFYQLQGASASDISAAMGTQNTTTTTTTVNADGTYTTTTTTLPAQLSPPPPAYMKGPEICVDTRTYGNEARFVRRSCRPNAEIQHLFEKGTIHLFIVALTDIRASTEITIRHEPHDLLAIENKKSSTMVIQPTSTPCACGLSKDCIFGPPLPQLPLAAKSNVGRKSQAQNGGGGGTLTAKQRKANQQNLNRNRSTSSSGDSNMGGATSAAPINLMSATLVPLGLNSPTAALTTAKAVGGVGNKSVVGNCNNAITIPMLPLTASCNSNLSNASSTSSSTLTSVMHDSGICTSSSSPSVSIPSPTPHMHSPIQHPTHLQHQHHQQQQQQQQQQLQAQTQQHLKTATTILPQQQQQQLMQSLPTPLILTTDMQPQKQTHHELQVNDGGGMAQMPHQQQQVLLKSPKTQQLQLQPLEQPLTVLSQSAPANQELANDLPEQQTILRMISPQPQILVSSQHQLQLASPQQQQTTIVVHTSSGDITPPEATIAATALQSLNCVQSNNAGTAIETLPHQIQVNSIAPVANVGKLEEMGPQILPMPEGLSLHANELLPSMAASSTITSATASSVCGSVSSTSPQQQQQQHHKSPHKNNQCNQNMPSHQGRKTPAKQARTTSFSEDMDQQNNDENLVSSAPNSSSTPKEKPKLSREDRKMEAILRAIEKMERNQQRKQEQKQAKRQNSGSHNTTPTSPNKTFDSGDSSGTKRSNSQSGGPNRAKKKRKAGNRGAVHNNQRKRRQSRMNSQESIDGGCGGGPHENDTVTSESDGCVALHSPPIQTVASQKESSSAATTPTAAPTTQATCENIPNNVDQAAGLLMAFANPIVAGTASPQATSSAMTTEPQSPQRPSHYMIPHETAASPPPTPPSHVSSACLLIEAAVGPLESNLEASCSPDVNNAAEFKYPPQAKTKKLLMNNWLHRAEENAVNNTVAPGEQMAPSPQLGCVTGGLDSLVQAALNDFKHAAPTEETELPQNLSIVAQRVEEFIQQTEGGPPTPPPTKHSYEYEHQQQQIYAMQCTPAVDLSLKHDPSAVRSPKPVTPDNKNFHLPLQVSTCSNNSSVKKRWLRQAISEESHEELQNNYSLSPSPTTPIVAPSTCPNTYVSTPQVQTVAAPISSPNVVPNGFTTPLKKRRLLLTDKDDEENTGSNAAESVPNTSLSPLPAENSPRVNNERLSTMVPIEYEEKPEIYQQPAADAPHQQSSALVDGDAEGEVDVDVEKCEHNDILLDKQCDSKEVVLEQEQDVDVTSPPFEEPIKTEVVTKHEDSMGNLKQESDESCHASMPSIVMHTPAEFHDQEDDVDILRSPSPGREMFKAEDNLVKIEPEDTSGNDDVKIDVEREESMAADDVPQVLKQELKQETTQHTVAKVEEQNTKVKQEYKIEASENVSNAIEDERSQKSPVAVTSTENIKVESQNVKAEEVLPDESGGEPKAKKLKLEEESSVAANETPLPVKREMTKQEEQTKDEKPTKVASKLEAFTKESIKAEKCTGEHEAISSSATVAAKVVANNTFTGPNSSTPPMLPSIAQQTSPCVSSSSALQRGKTALSDDDIQARLHSFHKENILILQSRNKKSKSSNSTSSSSSNSLAGNSEAAHRSNHKNNSLSSSNHHHHHDGSKGRAEKSDKLSTKHHKNSSSSSGSSKKQKLHKRERTTSSSSSSNSHKNSNSQVALTTHKNLASSSQTNSSISSKKVKSLKKSSSGSSTSSSNSTSSCSASLFALSNSHSSVADAKEKHQRQRTTSSSNSTPMTMSGNAVAGPSQTPFAGSKKRQLNFELELTKDLHLVNSMSSGNGKHRRQEDGQGHGSGKKSRKDSSSTSTTTCIHKDEQKNSGTTKQSYQKSSSSLAQVEKSQEKEKKATQNATTTGPAAKSSQANCLISNPPSAAEVVSSASTAVDSHIEEVNKTSIATPAVNILREHPTLPHFNNVVLPPSSSAINSSQIGITNGSPMPQQLLQPQVHVEPQPPAVQHIPVHVSNPGCAVVASTTQPSLPATPPPTVGLTSGGISSPLSSSTVSTSSHLPFFNTIYGKLLDNSTTSIAAAPSSTSSLSSSSSLTSSSMAAVSTPSIASTGVLSEYVDTKLKSYSTLGGYVTHTALFGLNNIPTKDMSTLSKDATNEMPAPPAPSAVSSSTATGASTLSLVLNATSSSPNMASMKMLTKTASHDPRLNPQLTAPEPPPQPKRKLSINEYRKRMQQTSSSESACNSLVSTPSTPPTPPDAVGAVIAADCGSGLGAVIINKCTLNSPERLTQSVDSQIQKEIIASSSSLNVYDSLNSSNSSSTSNSSLLNDSLLKSSSRVQEDSTKGQFNAAPTLLEKQQESLCARLKSLKEKQSLNLGVGGCAGSRSRFSSFSESVGGGSLSEFSVLRKDDDDLDILRKRNLSFSSSIGGMDLLDNCLEEISSTSTSMSSSRESSPERYPHSSTVNKHSPHNHSKHVLTASATATTMANNTVGSAGGSSNNSTSGQIKQQHNHHSQSSAEKNNTLSTNLERKKSVDIA
ncbi:serine-rich adhesin for platelets isoform X2 [Stomoxys calcitrans]|uniref:serine-rich adhesin for platelets isoform X2 n=1 Tax=Stomoxys calcitrans TaxID=35570 RepID=UPI0027E34361|nr:serine-rich adhesin for platelets isoform X2 [Stomoxys calcitrans]